MVKCLFRFKCYQPCLYRVFQNIQDLKKTNGDVKSNINEPIIWILYNKVYAWKLNSRDFIEIKQLFESQRIMDDIDEHIWMICISP